METTVEHPPDAAEHEKPAFKHPLDAYPITPRASKPKLPSGECVIAVAEEMTGEELPEADKVALRQITDDEGAAAFIKSNLGPDVDPNELQARSVFSEWLFRKIKVQPMMLTIHMQTIHEAEKAVEFANEALKKKDGVVLLPEQEAAFIKCLVAALEAKSKFVERAQKLAPAVVADSAPPKPKNRPPQFGNQTNILVQDGANVLVK